MAATSYVGDSPLFLIDYLLRLIRVLLLLSIWRTVMEDRGEVSGMTLGAVLTYTLISEAFSEQLAVRTRLAETFWEGSIATRLLQPLPFVGLFTAEMLGRWLFGLLVFTLPLVLVAPWLGVSPLPASPIAGALFVVSLVLATSVGLALDFVFGALTMALELPVWLLDYVRTAVSIVLSGALLPLALLPWGLGEVFAWLPFAATAWVPLSIYVGVGEPVRAMLLQVGWSLALWPLAMWLWRANRERVVGYGG